jgi:hypothetical protein
MLEAKATVAEIALCGYHELGAQLAQRILGVLLPGKVGRAQFGAGHVLVGIL